MSKRISDITPTQAMINDSDKFELEDVTGSTPGISKQATALTIADYVQSQGTPTSYGRMTFQGNSAETVIANPATPVKINGTYVSGNLAGFTHVNGTLIRTDSDTVQCLVVVKTTSSFNLVSGSMTIFIAHEGSIIADSGQSPTFSGISPDFKPLVCQALVTVAQGETLDVFIQNDNANDNITSQDLDCIVISTGGGSGGGSGGDTTLQEAWAAQVNGSITLDDGTKVFAVTEADGVTEIFRAHPTESVTLRGTNLLPPTIHGLGGNASLLGFKDTRNATIGSSGGLQFIATPLAGGPSTFSTLNFNVISENKGAGNEKTRIFMSNLRNGVTHTLLDMNPTAQTIIFGDPIVPLSLTTAEIASHPKSAGMLVRNQNTERLEYYDNLAESMKSLAYLDDIIPTESGRNTLVVNSTVDCSITGGPYFYNYIKVGNIVDLTFDIAFTTTTAEPAITVALPFTPGFTDFVQAYASTEVILQPAVGNLGDNAQVVSTNSTLSQISFVMGSTALEDYRLRATVKYQIQP